MILEILVHQLPGREERVLSIDHNTHIAVLDIDLIILEVWGVLAPDDVGDFVDHPAHRLRIDEPVRSGKH